MSERFANTVPADASTHDAGASTGLPRIALLYADEALLAHVEQTLAALRVPVVYRAAIEQADPAALTGARPEIALINLDDRCGDKLDALTGTLDAAGVPIVFNDADISNGLEGWARARWARHLCAKLCGKNDVDPPRPAAVAQIAAPPPAGTRTEAVAPQIAEAVAPAAEIAQPPPAAEDVTASRPLSQGEIDSLVADFPSDAVISGADTEALSAHIDALLANAADGASHEPAPWEVVGFVDEHEQPAVAPAAGSAKAESAATAPVAAKPVSAPNVDQWQLVDDFTPVAAAPREKPAAPAPAATFDSGLALELEPLDPTGSGQ